MMLVVGDVRGREAGDRDDPSAAAAGHGALRRCGGRGRDHRERAAGCRGVAGGRHRRGDVRQRGGPPLSHARRAGDDRDGGGGGDGGRADLSVPFGVDVLWDPVATLAVAKATGARFAREVFTGVFGGDLGLWNTAAGDLFQYRRAIGAENVRLLFTINAEFAAPVAPRPLAAVARSVAFSSLPDALCVSGPITGSPAPLEELRAAKEAAGRSPSSPTPASAARRSPTSWRSPTAASSAPPSKWTASPGTPWIPRASAT